LHINVNENIEKEDKIPIDFYDLLEKDKKEQLKLFKEILSRKNEFKIDSELVFENNFRKIEKSIKIYMDLIKDNYDEIELITRKFKKVRYVIKVRKVTWMLKFIAPLIENRKSIIIFLILNTFI
jgi:hypothetical protein